MMTRCLTAVTGIALMCGASSAFAADRADAGLVDQKVMEMTPPADSKAFAMKAAQSGICEVKIAQIAQQKSQNQQVKQLAQMLERDHTQANTELMALAKTKNITLSTDLPSDKQATIDAFGRLDGQAFDNAFLLHNVKAHLHSVMMFRQEAAKGTDTEVKAWAAKTLPKLEQHTSHIAMVAQAQQIPIEALAGGGRNAGDRAVPAGSRIEGSGSGTSGSGTSGSGTSTPRTGTGGGSSSGTGAGGSGTGTNGGSSGTGSGSTGGSSTGGTGSGSSTGGSSTGGTGTGGSR